MAVRLLPEERFQRMEEGKPHLEGLKPCPDGGLKFTGPSSSRGSPTADPSLTGCAGPVLTAPGDLSIFDSTVRVWR